ncbi:hypothetical protein CfE428DRAFT_4281 [Chthoniobacter flavus Ellin428]|uniref:Uncharacterized protein n=1 Tax=Chthoniobacter flavus Ellin428 TaxID=497964 RepID=B4D5U2_9BACT|nr:hypothetical protein [Chthoniobacter flavus]EDY18145.1 hypothetical protein CfE428DRAFT_4281 [Chthoniobacter flavus Ellin428]TCO91500.1 hypothetical protein EV701_108228 [Chthoniobacter flavus]
MISLKKRAAWGMAISVVCLVAGIALLCFTHDSLEQGLKKSFADIDKTNEGDIPIKLVVGVLPLMGGGALTVLGFILFPVFLATWIRNPPPGSKLGFRGWKTPDQMTESDVAQDKAWRAILWGLLATQSWILQICIGGYRGLLLPGSFAIKILVTLIVICIVLYALGIRLCRRRDPAGVAAAPWSWKLALALNYGGLLAFICFIGKVLFLRSRA